MGSDLVHAVMSHPNVQELMNSEEKFDICIIEVFNADAFSVCVLKLNYYGILLITIQ